MKLYVGGPPGWLWNPDVHFDQFVSDRSLRKYKTLRQATHRWALDSGGYTELAKHGRWVITPEEYVAAVARYDREIGGLDWAAPQDWICDPDMIEGGGPRKYPGTRRFLDPDGRMTHLELRRRHQGLTVENYLLLRNLWPQYSDNPRCPFIPMLQGWTFGDFLYCEDLYAMAGVDLKACPVVGIGSVASRQGDPSITAVIGILARKYRLHVFGVKKKGAAVFGGDVWSGDTMSWSYKARREPPLPGHTHLNCANCLEYAVMWLLEDFLGLDPV